MIFLSHLHIYVYTTDINTATTNVSTRICHLLTLDYLKKDKIIHSAQLYITSNFTLIILIYVLLVIKKIFKVS